MQDMERALRFLHPDQGVFELCGIGFKHRTSKLWEGFAGNRAGVVTGWFRDIQRAVELAAGLDQIGPEGIYVSMNPCDPRLLARSDQRLKAGISRTQDSEILGLKHLLIDFDPRRPSGVSSDENQHRMAIDHAHRVQSELSANGWPQPLLADSGNGAHLIYKVDLENTEANANLLKACLKVLHNKYSTQGIEIDTKVYNASRLCKLYGTTARKGDNTADWPHRLSKILDIPSSPLAVSRESLIDLVEFDSDLPVVSLHERQSTGAASPNRLDVHEYLRFYGVKVKKIKVHGSSTLFVIENCLFDPSHCGGESAIGQTQDGTIFYQCFHNSCREKKWSDARQVISGNESLRQFIVKDSSTLVTGVESASDVSDGRTHPVSFPLENRKAVSPPASFPLDVFPEPIRQVLVEIKNAYCVPIEIPAATLLSVAGACIGRTRGIQIKPGWIEFANLWIAIVGSSGLGKSPVVREIQQHIFKMEKIWHAEYQSALSAYNSQTTNQKHSAPRKRNDDGASLLAPKCCELIVDDTTIEALTDALEANPRGILWNRDELAGLINDFDKYTGTGKEGGTKSRLMTSYDSGPWKVNRKYNSKKTFIPHATVSIFGTIQPGTLRSLFSSKDASSGFLPRFSFVIAQRNNPALWSDDMVSEDASYRLSSLIKALLSLKFEADGTPHILNVGEEAKSVYQAWYNELALELWGQNNSEANEAIVAKVRGQCLRIALILHFIKHFAVGSSEPGIIEKQTMEGAIRLVNFLKEHQKRAWQLIFQGSCDKELNSLQRRVAEAILKLQGTVDRGVLFTQQVTDAVNAGVGNALRVSSRSVGNSIVSLGFTTRKSNGLKCFEIREEDLRRLDSSLYGTCQPAPEVPEVPKIPEPNANGFSHEPNSPLESPQTPCESSSQRDSILPQGHNGTGVIRDVTMTEGLQGLQGLQPTGEENPRDGDEWEEIYF